MHHSTSGKTPAGATLGTDGNDVFIGGEGADTYAGGFGNDYIEGGAGNDWLEDGFGSDWLVGGDGDDVLRSTSDTGESRIGQLVLGDPSRPSAGDIDMSTYTLDAYNQPLIGDDVMTGGAGKDHFLFELQINAKEHIIEKHADADGNINWHGVAGENTYMHDHWVDGIGVNVITDFNADEDKISILGHTAQVGVDYKMIDSDGDGVNDEWVTILKAYSQQGMAGGAHDEDILGYVVVHGDRVYGDLVNTDANVHYGIVDNISDIDLALNPMGDTKTHSDPDLFGYDSRDVSGDPIGSDPEAYSSNPWLLDGDVDVASGAWNNAPDTGAPAADDGVPAADDGDDSDDDAANAGLAGTLADDDSGAAPADGGSTPEMVSGPSIPADDGGPAADDGDDSDDDDMIAVGLAGTLADDDSGAAPADGGSTPEMVSGPSVPADDGGPAADDGGSAADDAANTGIAGTLDDDDSGAALPADDGMTPEMASGPSVPADTGAPTPEIDAGPTTPADPAGPADDLTPTLNVSDASDDDDGNILSKLFDFLFSIFGGGDDDAPQAVSLADRAVSDFDLSDLPMVPIDTDQLAAESDDDADEPDDMMIF